MNKTKKTSIYFTFSNFNISGVLSFAINLTQAINFTQSHYEASILLISNGENDFEKVKEYCGANVKILNIPNSFSGQKRLQVVLDFLNSHSKAIFLPSYYFNLQLILPFLHQGIKSIQVLHSDEKVYYDSTRLFGSYYDHIVSVSPLIESKLKGLDPYLSAKSSMIQYGVDIADKYRHSFDDTIKIVYFGRIVEEQKRVSRMVKIIKKLSQTDINYEWTFIGEGSEVESMQRDLALQIEEKKVKFLSSMSVQEVQEYAYSQDIYILTSDYEGTPLALMEAMGCGCIPIVNDIKSGIPEMVKHGETGYIVKDSSFDEYIEYINKLYSDKSTRKVISKNCYEYSKKFFDTSVMTRKYLSIFDKLNFTESKVANELDIDLYLPIASLISSESSMPLLKSFYKIAIFGWGASGQLTYKYLEEKLSNRVVCIIDDNKTTECEDIPIVNTEEFLSQYHEKVEIIVFGAFQKLNPILLDKINIPHLRLYEVT